MIPYWKLVLFGLLPFGVTAAPLITSIGRVSAHKFCGGDCDVYEFLGESAGECQALNLSITRGDHVQTVTADLDAMLGPISGTVVGRAEGSCEYSGADNKCFGSTSSFLGSIEGRFVVTGGSGIALLQPGEILTDGFRRQPSCEVIVDDVSGTCGDAFELTFGVPFDLTLRFSGDAGYVGSTHVEFFSFQYTLDRARQTGTGAEYAMS